VRAGIVSGLPFVSQTKGIDTSTMTNHDNPHPEGEEKNPPNEEAPTPHDDKAGLTKEDGTNAFKAVQDKKDRPEDILYLNPDDIENPEDIISG
jgi:hypothetical protein